jgi:hypothetical protein
MQRLPLREEKKKQRTSETNEVPDKEATNLHRSWAHHQQSEPNAQPNEGGATTQSTEISWT